MGKKKLFIPVPLNILYALGSILGKKNMLNRLCVPLQADISKAKKLLNWQPQQSLYEGLNATVNWYKSI